MRAPALAALCAALIGLAASGASAQEAAPETPAEVMHVYNAAIVEQDWETAASLVAEEDLAKLTALAQLIYDSDPLTSRIMGLDPEAEPGDLLSVFVGAAMNQLPGLDQMVADAEVEVIGEVAEGDDLVHIVSRSSMEFYDRPIVMIETTTVQRIDGLWRYRLSGEIDAMRVGMELAIEQPELFAPDLAPPPVVIDEPADPKKQ